MGAQSFRSLSAAPAPPPSPPARRRKEQHPPNAEHYGPAEGKREHRTLLAPAEYVAAITDSQPQPIGLDALGSEWQPSPSQLTAGSPLGAHGGGSERRGGAEAGAEAAAGQRGSRGGGGGASGGGESSSDSEDDMPLAQLWAAKHAGSAGRGGSAAVHDAAASPAAAGRGPESTGPDAAAAGAAAAAAAAVAAAAAEPGVAIAAAVPAAGPDSAPGPTPSQPAAATGAAAAEAGAAASPPAAPRPPVLAGPGTSEVRSPAPQLGASVPGVAAAVEEEDAQQQQQQQVEEEQGGEEVGEEAVTDLVSPAAAKPAGATQGLGAGPEEGASGGGGGAPEVICIPDRCAVRAQPCPCCSKCSLGLVSAAALAGLEACMALPGLLKAHATVHARWGVPVLQRKGAHPAAPAQTVRTKMIGVRCPTCDAERQERAAAHVGRSWVVAA